MANVFIEESTLTAIADSIRAKTGSSEGIYPADMPAAIEGITGSGGTVEGVVYVTFHYTDSEGNQKEFTRPVYSGDDCPDPVTQGRIDTPAKASTDQYEYTFSGDWSAEQDGTADADILKNITADKSVYPVFTAEVREYTVSFYDGDELKHTEQVAYGGSSDYVYEKDNYMFLGWTPEPTNITGDLACYGEWEESYSFADASWEYIANISDRGLASSAFALGDEKEITLNYEDGTTEQVILYIAGFDSLYTEYSYADETGTTAGLAICAKTLLKTDRVLGSVSSSAVTKFTSASLCTWLNETLYNALPTEMQSAIKPYAIDYNMTYNSATGGVDYNYVYCNVGIPTQHNLLSYGQEKAIKYLSGFKINNSNKKTKYGSTSYTSYWLSNQSGDSYSNTSGYYVTTSGSINTQSKEHTAGVCPMFAI